MRKQWVRDWGRRLLILLLLASAVLLLRNTGYYDGIRSSLERSRSKRTEQSAETENFLPRPDTAIMPTAVTVRGTGSGGRYGAAYEDGAVSETFRRFALDLSEALGSAGTPVECSETDFRDYMNRCCVAMHFSFPIRLELLSGWLGVEMNSAAAQQTAQILCLSASETEAQLCYRTEEGICCACSTAVNAEGFCERASDYTPNGAMYGWESDRLSDGGYFLLLETLPEPTVVVSSVPQPRGNETNAMLSAMGMNSFVASSYTESDGTVVYVSEEMTMRFSPTGELFFRRGGSPAAEDPGDIAAAVSRAWQAAERCIGQLAGDAALRLSGAVWNISQRSYTVTLDYYVDGIPVRLASGHAGEIVVRGDTVIQARLHLRQFTQTQARTKLLPCLQTAAIAERQQRRPELIYADGGAATECMWVMADG